MVTNACFRADSDSEEEKLDTGFRFNGTSEPYEYVLEGHVAKKEPVIVKKKEVYSSNFPTLIAD